ncbi:hypothetical protein CBL_09480 [Carabus blaptoides fortunei]
MSLCRTYKNSDTVWLWDFVLVTIKQLLHRQQPCLETSALRQSLSSFVYVCYSSYANVLSKFPIGIMPAAHLTRACLTTNSRVLWEPERGDKAEERGGKLSHLCFALVYS